MRDDFATFILTHGRAGRVDTYRALRRCGYTGKIYLLVDSGDKQLKQYQEEYGDEVIVFDKEEAAKITDAGDNFGRRNSVLFARNQNFVIAKEMGLKYFWQLDDDYSSFGYAIDPYGKYVTTSAATKKLDQIIDASLTFLENSGAHSVAFAQGGDFIGGENGNGVKRAREGKFMRKVMNSFFFSTERPIKFVGVMNDDVNMFVTNSARGNWFATITKLRLWQKETQSNAGGLTDIYLDVGTYVKSFYSVMMAPSCVSIMEMGGVHKRLHHQVRWKNAAPMIIDESHRKPRDE